MGDILERVWHNVLARTEGPMHFRFFIQPLVSLVFAVLAGLRDVKSGAAPYFKRFVSAEKGQRKAVAKETWTDVGRVFIMGITLDIIYQLVLIYGMNLKSWFYPFESVLVAIGLAIVPYLLIRGPLNRILTWPKKKKAVTTSSEATAIGK